MLRRPKLKFITLGMTLICVLAACRPETSLSPTPTAENPSATLLATPVSAVTPTATQSPTIIPTILPSATASPTPTATTPWGRRVLALTPLPPVTGGITRANAAAVLPLAVWGQASANTIALSPDGQVLAVGTDLGAALYDSQSYARLAMVQTSSPVWAIAFASGNQLLALGQADGAIDVVERNGFAVQTRLTPEAQNPDQSQKLTLAFSPTGDELIQVIETKNVIQLNRWKAENWQPLTAFSLNSGLAAYISPKLDLIGVIADEDLTLQSLTYPEEHDLIDLPATISPAFWEQMAVLGGVVAPASNGEFILISNGAALTYWPMLDEDFRYLLDDYPGSIPDPCAIAPDTCLNSAGGFSWECRGIAGTPPIELIALTPDDVMVLISRNDQRTEFRRASDSMLLWEINATFTDVAFSPGGEFFFGLRPDGTLEKRTTLDGALMDTLDQHPSQLYTLAIAPDSAVLAAGYSDGWIRVFSTGNGQMLGVLDGNARSVTFSPDGALLAAGLSDGTVRIFFLEEGRQVDLAPGHFAAVTDLAFSPDGSLLLTGSEDCTASLWQVEDRTRLTHLTPDRDNPFRITRIADSFSTGILAFAGNRSGLYLLRDTPTAFTLVSPELEIRDLALSPGENALAVAGEGVWLQLLPVGTGSFPAARALGTGPSGDESFAVAINPTGNVLVAASMDELTFWSVEDGALLGSLPIRDWPQAESPPVALTFSPDSALLALGTANGLIQIFGIPSGN